MSISDKTLLSKIYDESSLHSLSRESAKKRIYSKKIADAKKKLDAKKKSKSQFKK